MEAPCRGFLDWTVRRGLDPRDLSHLGALAAAGVIGFLGNELATQVRLRGGRRLRSPALAADGNHARGWLRLPGLSRERILRVDRRADRRSPDRDCDHARDPEDHLGQLAGDPRDRARSSRTAIDGLEGTVPRGRANGSPSVARSSAVSLLTARLSGLTLVSPRRPAAFAL